VLTISRYKVKNWSEYDESLKKRGSITFWFSNDAIDNWYYDGPTYQGRTKDYSDLAIETMLILKKVYHLNLRATEGFLESLMILMNIELEIPDHSTLSRRQQHLSVDIPREHRKMRHIVVDSSGLKVYGEGEWKVRTHGANKRRTWRKLHLGVDESTKEIVANILTKNNVDDGEELAPTLDQVESQIEAVGADGAYDKKKVYNAIEKRSQEQDIEIKVIIPPRRNAKIWQHGNCKKPPLPRDENLRYIRQHGRKKWKRDSGYHRRSLSETTFFRYKIIIGRTLSSRTFERQKVEAKIGCKILNKMTTLAMPDSYKVA
jgi:transposase